MSQPHPRTGCCPAPAGGQGPTSTSTGLQAQVAPHGPGLPLLSPSAPHMEAESLRFLLQSLPRSYDTAHGALGGCSKAVHVLGSVVAVTGAAAGYTPYRHSRPIPGYLLHQPGQVTSLGPDMFLTCSTHLRPQGSVSSSRFDSSPRRASAAWKPQS